MSVVIRPNVQHKHHIPRDYADRPMLVYWEMTQACGLACRHCRAEAMPQAHPLQLTNAESRRLLQQIAAFGVETMAPGVLHVSNKEVHHICGELGFTHYENLINLHQLIGRGRFRFIGLPLKIRGGTGSPVRAIAVFEG